MKSKALKIGFTSIFLFSLIFAVVLLVRPISNEFKGRLLDLRASVIYQLEEKTGLRFSYQSISPSILSAFNIKGIIVYNAESEIPLLEINKINLSYNLIELLKGNIDSAFSKLSIHGITLEYDFVKNQDLLNKILSLISTSKEQNTSQKISHEKEQSKNFNLNIPFDISIQDISLHYKDNFVDALIRFREIFAEQSQKDTILKVSFLGQAKVELQENLVNKLPKDFASELKNISAIFSLEANILPELNKSNAMFRLRAVDSALFELARTSFLLEYEDDCIKVSTMQDVLPFFVSANFNVKNNNLKVAAEFDDFDPFSFVKIKKSSQLIETIKGILISGKYQFEIFDKKISYLADGGVFINSKILPSGGFVDFNILGDATDVNIYELNVQSKLIDLNLEGSFNIPNFRPSGIVYLEKLAVNDGIISGEAYIDPLDTGFVCFIPQIFLDQRSFTAIQLTVIPNKNSRSIDFAFEASDYSHIDFGSPGILSVSGSLIGGKNPYIQAQVGISDFFLDTFAYTAAFFVKDSKDTLLNVAESLEPFMTTNEIYFATDLSSFTYNVPYWIVANTRQDQMLVFSFTGNESSLNLSSFDLLYAGQNIQLSADFSIDSEMKSAFFVADANVNSIPYNLNGTYLPEIGLSIVGSYGLETLIKFDFDSFNGFIDGTLKTEELPIAVGKAVMLLSTDINAFVPLNDKSNFIVDIKKFALSEGSGILSFDPKILLSGNIDKLGFRLDNIIYNDLVSILTGNGSVMWDISDSMFKAGSLNLNLSNTSSQESYQVGLSLTNPEKKDLSVADFLHDYYFSSQIVLEKFPMSRFLPLQTEDNVLSGIITAMGTLENPYVVVQVNPSSIALSGVPFDFQAVVRLEDSIIHLDDANIKLNSHEISNIRGNFSIPNFSGNLGAMYSGKLGKSYTLSSPINIAIDSSAQEVSQGFSGFIESIKKGLPEYIEAQLNMTLDGSFFETPQDVSVNFIRVPGFISIDSKNNLGISGTIAEGGIINMELTGRMPFHAIVEGSIQNQQLDLNVRNFWSDLSKFSRILHFPYVALYGGLVSGNVHFGGLVSDPDFDGKLVVDNLDLNCPNYVPEHIIGETVPIILKNNEIFIDKAPFTVDTGNVFLDLKILFDRWMLDVLSLQIKTPNNIMIPATISIPPMVTIDGQSTCDLDITVTLNSTDIKGKFYTENIDIEVLSDINQFSSSSKSSSNYIVTLDIDVTTGQHVEVVLNPLLRGLIEPNTNILFQFDSRNKDFSIKSDIVLRGGEITYLNRNFYLREGRINLNETGGIFDPFLTIRAEIRERDENGEPVRIIMSAENQRLSAFNPSYSSSPAKSELEIMTMLGQAVTGDVQSGIDVLLTSVDYGFQVFVLRKIENALRDLLNFDIVSLRTMGLQNSLRQWLNVKNEGKELTLSNFLDNTTVYIGKYFGSSIYALLHFAYDESKILNGESVSGLVFQPEIGLEMDSPFGTIRWSLAPEIGSTQHLWVPASSISLSWKFTF